MNRNNWLVSFHPLPRDHFFSRLFSVDIKPGQERGAKFAEDSQIKREMDELLKGSSSSMYIER